MLTKAEMASFLLYFQRLQQHTLFEQRGSNVQHNYLQELDSKANVKRQEGSLFGF